MKVLSYRDHAEAALTDGNRWNKTWWQPLATAAIYALLAIAEALERKDTTDA